MGDAGSPCTTKAIRERPLNFNEKKGAQKSTYWQLDFEARNEVICVLGNPCKHPRKFPISF